MNPRALLAFWILLAVIGARPATVSGIDSEHWYEFSIAEVPCGYLHRSVSTEAGVCLTTTLECLHIERNGVPVRLESRHLFEETTEGIPLRASFSQEGAEGARTSTLVFEGDRILITTTRGSGAPSRSVRPDPGGWLTPRGVVAHLRDRIASGAERIEYRVLRSSGVPGTTQQIRMHRLDSNTPSTSSGGTEPTCWEVHREGEALALQEWRSPTGLLVESRMETGIGPIMSSLTDRARALSSMEGPAFELMRSTLVEVPSMPRASDRIVTAGYRVRLEPLPGGAGRIPISAGAQRVRAIGESLYEFEIDASRGSPADPGELANPAFSSSSQAIDSSDPEIIEFTRRALEGASADQLERAECLRVAVDHHVSRKSLSSALESASQVVRSRSGDCTEHAMLLAAALRSDGIPSRVAIGLVHVELGGGTPAAFAWHMWTQGLIDGTWYDFDSTRRNRFDGGHLLVAVDAGSDEGGGPRMSALLGLVGRISIELFMLDGVAVGDSRDAP